jgi:hypothetical protein
MTSVSGKRTPLLGSKASAPLSGGRSSRTALTACPAAIYRGPAPVRRYVLSAGAWPPTSPPLRRLPFLRPITPERAANPPAAI